MRYLPLMIPALLSLCSGCVSAAEDPLELFLPGQVSTDLEERDLSFSPDGSTLAYTLSRGRHGTIVLMTRGEAGWHSARIAPFSGTHSDLEAHFAADGYLYFASNRPGPHSSKGSNFDIWRTRYLPLEGDLSFGPVENLGSSINSESDEFYPSLNAAGDLYLTARRDGAPGDEDIFVSRRMDQTFGPLTPLGTGVNSAGAEFNAMISADDRMLLFTAWGRDDGPGGGDLYVSHRGDDGRFTAAVVLPEPINSPALDFNPLLWADGQRLYFTSRRADPVEPGQSLEAYQKSLRMPANGRGDIYVIAAPEQLTRPQ